MKNKKNIIDEMNKNAVSHDQLRRMALPIFWEQKARELHCAAEAVYETSSNENVELKSHLLSFYNNNGMILSFLPDLPDASRSLTVTTILRATLFNIYPFLAALAIENLFKGIICCSNYYPDTERKELPKWLFKHNLITLAEHANISLSDNEREFCELGTQAIVEWGRYPIPKQGKLKTTTIMSRGYDVKVIREVFEELFLKLVVAIYPDKVF